MNQIVQTLSNLDVNSRGGWVYKVPAVIAVICRFRRGIVLISKGGTDSKSYIIYSITNFDNPSFVAFSSNAVSMKLF